MVFETKLSFAQFYETRFYHIIGICIRADQAVESNLTSRGRLALTHISNCLSDLVLFSHPFAGVSTQITQFHALWHEAIRELEPQASDINPGKGRLEIVNIIDYALYRLFPSLIRHSWATKLPTFAETWPEKPRFTYRPTMVFRIFPQRNGKTGWGGSWRRTASHTLRCTKQ